MQHKLLTLLLIVFGIAAVLGRSQIRFMNARFYSGQTIDITTNIYSINQTSMALPSRYNAMTDDIPVTSYVQLPTSSIPEGSYVMFYAYNKDDLVIPVNVLANRSVEALQTQSYTLVYVDRTDDSYGDPVTNVPAQLFIFEELIPQAGSFLKIVNVAAASYPYGSLTVNLDRYGVVYVPYGSDSGFLEIAPGLLNVTVYLPGTTKTLYITLTNFTATLYIRGDIATDTYFGYDLVEHDPEEYWSFEPASPPVYPTTPTSTPTSAPNGPLPVQIRYLNTYSLGLYAFALFDQNYNVIQNVTTSALNTGYQTLYNAGYYFISVSNYDFAGGVNAWLQAGMRYTVFYSDVNSWTILEDSPVGYNNYNQSYLRIVNNVPGSSFIQLFTPSQGWNTWYSDNGEIRYTQFLAGSSGMSELYIDTSNQTVYESFYLYSGMATTIYLYGTENVMVYIDQQPLIVVPTEPVCVNGYVESNGVCNCYAGYTSDASPYKCTVVAPYYCFRNQSDALSNDYVPYIPYWTAQVYGNQLSFSVYSDIVAGRRTLVELPNSQCSFINSPQYYQKYNNGCEDRLDVNIPFTECGFTKTSTSTEDVYKGTVHVKQIDRVTVAGTTYDRVIDTPMPIAIRMPKTLAIESYVQVYGPPSLAIDAAFVGQTVSTESQSGNLQYVSAVQYPLQIATVQLVDLPYGVSAWIEVVNVNCSGVGPCVQRLEVHLNTSSCSISGVYRMVVSLSCRSDQGCPDEAKNGTQVYIESRIVSQSLCGEMAVDIDLNGYIQAFTDQSFSNPALAFYPGQSAYFLINAYSSRVSLSKVSIESVYYYGPNVNYQYLAYNTSLSTIAIANNFTTGTQGTSQAWFGLDVSVSTPNSGDNSTLFKLYQGQNGVYNFVAIVDVEWYVANNAPSVTPYAYQPSSTATPTNTPISYAPTYEPQPPFKKRMVLQGAVSNQGSQFTAQVQVAGPTPSSQQPPQQQQQQTPVAVNPGTTDNKPVSSGVSLSSSLFVIAVAFVALF